MNAYMNDFLKQNEAKLVKAYLLLDKVVRTKLEKEYKRRTRKVEEDISYTSKVVDIIQQAKELAEKYNKTIEDVNLYHKAYEDYDRHSSTVRLTVDVLETDNEYYARLMEQYNAIKTHEENDRKEFERLKAKFGA